MNGTTYTASAAKLALKQCFTGDMDAEISADILLKCFEDIGHDQTEKLLRQVINERQSIITEL